MAVKLNGKGKAHAASLITAGKVDRDAAWDLTPDDENDMLGDPPDWGAYSKWFLGQDTAADEESKAAWKYPFGKGGQVYRKALVAIRSRAGQQGVTAIFDAAGSLIEAIDKGANAMDDGRKSDDVDEPQDEGEPTKAAPMVRAKMQAPFEVKDLKPATDDLGGWEFKGHFSVFDNVDLDGDIVRKGAFNDSLAVHLPKVLDHHGTTVGQATTAREDATGLYVEGRIYPTQAGSDLAKLMTPIETDHGMHAPVEQGSIGYSVLASKKRPTKGLELTRLFTWEVSPVTFGANPATNIGLKALGDLHTMPTGELMEYAGQVTRMAVDGADGVKALQRRRVAEDRDLTDEQWKAVDELALSTAETTLDLLTMLARAERKSSSAQMRHTRAIIDGLVELVHGRASEPPAPPEPVADEDDEDDEAAKVRAEAGDDGAESRSKDLRGRAIDLDILLADMGVSVDHTEA